jgi:pyruvate/2-oxoacid:ferredoxin oxidoreductase beta subunit
MHTVASAEGDVEPCRPAGPASAWPAYLRTHWGHTTPLQAAAVAHLLHLLARAVQGQQQHSHICELYAVQLVDRGNRHLNTIAPCILPEP